MIFYSYLITRKSFSWVKSANKSPKTVRLTYTSETENDHLNFVIVCLEFHQIFKGVAGCYCLNSIFFFWLPNFAIAESFVNARHFSEKSLDNQPNIQPAIRRSRRPLNHHRGVARIFQRGFTEATHQITIRGSPTIYGLYRCFPSCISGLSRIIVA